MEIVDFTGIVGRSLHIFHVKLKNLSHLQTQPRRGKSCGNRGNCTNSSIVSTSTTLRCRLCPSFDDSKFRPLTCPKNNKRKTTSHPTSSPKVTGLTAQQQLSARRSGSIEACRKSKSVARRTERATNIPRYRRGEDQQQHELLLKEQLLPSSNQGAPLPFSCDHESV